MSIVNHVQYGLLVIKMCQCKFIDCKKWTTMEGDVGIGGSYTCVGAEDMWVTHPLNYAMNQNFSEKINS